MYKENPKTAGSGIVCAITQNVRCPVGCDDCFYQSGRGYLKPGEPNIPPGLHPWEILRVNDGNDSNVQREECISITEEWAGRRFFNTSIPVLFDEPWVLTINPGHMTDEDWHKLPEEKTENLMFVRFRANAWNIFMIGPEAAEYYVKMGIPVVLTWMAYYDTLVRPGHGHLYEFRKRTTNDYFCIKRKFARDAEESLVIQDYRHFVHTCGHRCKDCGHCAREFMRVKEMTHGMAR